MDNDTDQVKIKDISKSLPDSFKLKICIKPGIQLTNSNFSKAQFNFVVVRSLEVRSML